MFRWIWLGLLCLLMVVGSGCAVGGNEEVIVSRTIQPQETPLAATETIEPTAVSQLPDPTATTTPSPTNTATPSPTPMVTPTALPTTTPTALTLTTHSWDADLFSLNTIHLFVLMFAWENILAHYPASFSTLMAR